MLNVDREQNSLAARAVSPNNPCPFLRALVADGLLDGHIEPLTSVANVVNAMSAASPQGAISKLPVCLIALVANGLKPSQLFRNFRKGVHLDSLRGGPLDKRGTGTRVINQQGEIVERELARLDEFASKKTDPFGQIERGLNLEELEKMMDANFKRAAGQRRFFDRKLMNGEWPILLRIMGKNVGVERYLSVSEIRKLCIERRLPERVLQLVKQPPVKI
jgi:hypothetical protein